MVIVFPVRHQGQYDIGVCRIGCPDVSKNLPWQSLRMGATPTPLEAMCSGNGQTKTIDNYRVAWYGPTKDGRTIINEVAPCSLRLKLH
jgi:hypothetical protein